MAYKYIDGKLVQVLPDSGLKRIATAEESEFLAEVTSRPKAASRRSYIIRELKLTALALALAAAAGTAIAAIVDLKF